VENASTLAYYIIGVSNIHRQIGDVGYICQKKDNTLDAIKFATLEGKSSQPQEDDANHHHRHIDRRDALNFERRNSGTGTNDKRYIEDV
jgi:hypothetical protein